MSQQFNAKKLSGVTSRWFAEANDCHTVDAAIATVVEEMLYQTQNNIPPVRLDRIAPLRAVRKTVYTSNIRSGGKLEVVPTGFMVFLQSGVQWYKRKEYWAHELGHTFFYNIATSPPSRAIEYGGAEEEAICDLIAREMVAPRQLLVENLKTDCCSVMELRRLCKVFQMTHITMLYRLLVDLELWTGVALLCEESAHLFPDSKIIRRPEVTLRVVRSISSSTGGLFVPRNKVVSETPVIQQVYMTGDDASGQVDFERFGNLKGKYSVEAMSLPAKRGDPYRILALVHMNETKIPRQLDEENQGQQAFDFD
jgi:hypothetical protein